MRNPASVDVAGRASGRVVSSKAIIDTPTTWR
jgi:hypothetical protein